MLDDAKLCRPGWERTRAIRSATDRTGESALTINWMGVEARLVMPLKSFSGSCDMLVYSEGLINCPDTLMSSV
ncbi:hypothetical protein D3C72_2291200 [compost metagenome]